MKSIQIDHMNLKQIADSGQCFTWRALGEGHYLIEALGTYVEAEQKGQWFSFSCEEEEFEAVWSGYFDLQRDYGALKERIDPEDHYLKAAASYGHGIRMLRQDLWEVMVSFLLSQNNNISRIRNSIYQLKQQFGCCLCEDFFGEPSFRFPRPDELARGTEEEFLAAGLGYRAKYLVRLVQEMKGGGLAEFQAMVSQADDEEARVALMNHYGIGRKVADCICLFGLARTHMFPVDTHIKKIIEKHYAHGFPYDRYGEDQGIYQQYMFYYDLRKNK